MSQKLSHSSTYEKQLAPETIPTLLTTPVSATEIEGVDMDSSDTAIRVQQEKPKKGEEISEVKAQDVNVEIGEEVEEEEESEEEPEEEHYEGYYLIEGFEADDAQRAYRASAVSKTC
jgi:hypothetical protein